MTARLALVPLALFAALALLLYRGLSLDPHELPSVLIDQPLPTFTLPPLRAGGAPLSSAALADGQVSVLNVFASWCAPCRQEMPLLASLARQGDVRVVGLIYKDQPEATRRFLSEFGDPFTQLGQDQDGRTGIELGVYGVPETFIIDGHGRIVFKHVGPITAESLAQRIRPTILAARSARGTP